MLFGDILKNNFGCGADIVYSIEIEFCLGKATSHTVHIFFLMFRLLTSYAVSAVLPSATVMIDLTLISMRLYIREGNFRQHNISYFKLIYNNYVWIYNFCVVQ